MNPFLKDADSNPFMKDADAPVMAASPENASAIGKGFHRLGTATSFGKDMSAFDYDAGAANIAEAAQYDRANPSSPQAKGMKQAWDEGEGIIGGVKGVVGEIKSDFQEAPTFVEGVKETGRNIKALGSAVVEQMPYAIPPLAGMATGFAATAAIPVPGARVLGVFTGASMGNALVEGQGVAREAIQEAGIDPQDQVAVSAYLRENAGSLFKKTATKGAIIGAVDTATMGASKFLLTNPGKLATKKILKDMGVDATSKSAVKEAVKSEAFKKRLLSDVAYQGSKQGVEGAARNITAATLEPLGEFVGEYVGSGIALDNWDSKNAALEALSSIGQSGMTFAGQKAYQMLTDPKVSSQDKEDIAQSILTGELDTGINQTPMTPQESIDAQIQTELDMVMLPGADPIPADYVEPRADPFTEMEPQIREDELYDEFAEGGVPTTRREEILSNTELATSVTAKMGNNEPLTPEEVEYRDEFVSYKKDELAAEKKAEKFAIDEEKKNKEFMSAAGIEPVVAVDPVEFAPDKKKSSEIADADPHRQAMEEAKRMGGINIDAKQMFSSETIKGLSKVGLFTKNGQQIDDMATQLGYESANELVDSWSGAKLKKDAVADNLAEQQAEWDIAADGLFESMKADIANEPMSVMPEEIGTASISDAQKVELHSLQAEGKVKTAPVESVPFDEVEEAFKQNILKVFKGDGAGTAAVMALQTAHAESMGLSLGEYISKRGIEIRPDSKLADEKGKPLDQDAKGQVRIQSQGKAIIDAFKEADGSTMIHEMFHVSRRDLSGSDLKTLGDWAGAKDSKWSVAAEEKAARGFERYITEGVAPTKALKQVFEKLKTMMLSIYGSLSHPDINVDISPEVRAVFDRMLGADGVVGGVVEDGSNVYIFKQEKPAQKWYSPTAKAVLNIKQKKGSGKQMLAMIRKAPGVKQEELDWIGLPEWLEGQKSVTREEIAEFVDAGGVQVEEVVKGGELTHDRLGWLKRGNIYRPSYEFDYGYIEYLPSNKKYIANLTSGTRDAYDNIADAKDEILRIAKIDGVDGTKFASYQLPSGGNYTELLLKLPVKSEQVVYTNDNVVPVTEKEESAATNPDMFWYFKVPDNVLQIPKSRYDTESDAKEYVIREKQPEPFYQDDYVSGHYDEPNILAHIRFNERTDADGKRVLFLEEVQSDWHQEGRKKGYTRPLTEAEQTELDLLIAQKKKIFEKHGGAKAVIIGGRDNDASPDIVNAYNDVTRLRTRINEITKISGKREGGESTGGVPDAPFKKTPAWSGLAMKRMIRYASENGFDSIAWTSGEQQAERYDLSKRVDHAGYSDNGVLSIYDKEGNNIYEQETSENKIEDVIGKIPTERLLASDSVNGWRVVKGDDLKVGGEGMKAFYDKMLPNTVNKLIKKYGYNVQEMTVGDNQQLGFQITDKMRDSALSEGMPLFQTKTKPYTQATLTGAKQKWQEIADKNDLSAKAERLVTYLVDKDAPISRVQKELPEQPEGRDYNLHRRLMGKKIADETEVFDKETLSPLLEYMAKSKLSIKDVEDLAYAEHVPERNLQMKRVNARRYIDSVIKELPSKEAKVIKEKISVIKKYESKNRRRDSYVELMDELANKHSESEFSQTWNDVKDRLSGSTNEEAEQVVSDWKKKENYKENKIAVDKLRKIGSDALEMSYKAGEIAKEEYDSMKATYKKHVPLYREDRESSKSYSLTKVAAGSTKKVVDIFAHVVDNYQGTISRKHKLEASKVLYDMIKANPDNSMWSLEEQEKAPYLDNEGNIRLYPDIKEPDNGMYIKVDGEKHLVSVPHDNKSMRRFMDSLKDTPAPLGPVLKASQKVNRFLAQLNTSFSPEFMVTNFIRDIQTAGIHMEDTAAKGMQKKIYKDIKQSIVGIYKSDMGKPAGAWGEVYNDFKKNGGKISWMQGYENVDELAKQLEADLEYVSGNRPKRAKFKKLMEFVSATNTAVENGVRLSTYKHLLDSGVSKKKAAHIVSNLTVDFTRHGAAGPVINSLWMFANAGIQGNARMVKAVSKNKKVQKIVGGIVAFGFAANIMGSLAGGDDEDGEAYYDKLKRTNPSLFERNMVFMVPGSKGASIKIPMPYGYGLFFSIGNEMASAIRRPEGYSNIDGMARVMSTFLNTFNPIGAATVLQTLSPTVTDPIVQSMENKAWHGGDLMPGVSPFGVAKPDSERYWKNVNPAAKWATKRINSLTGGSAVKPGVFDISPETVENMVENYTGSLGRFAKDVVSLPLKALDEGIEAGDIPFVRKLVGSKSEYADSKIYRENRDKVETYTRERAIGGGVDASLRSMIVLTKSTEKRLRRMRNRLRSAEDSGNDELAKSIKDRMLVMQLGYNKQFNKAVYNN